MSVVTCEAGNCLYNHNYKCHKRLINIVGVSAKSSSDTECINFIQGSKQIYKDEIAEFERNEYETNLNCTAHQCKFNKNFFCHKEAVKVTGKKATETEDTACESFEK